MRDFCLVDDSVSGVGGTSLTLDAIVEPEEGNVDFIPTNYFTLKDAFCQRKCFIFGNITSLRWS